MPNYVRVRFEGGYSRCRLTRADEKAKPACGNAASGSIGSATNATSNAISITLTSTPSSTPWSTYHRYVREGFYAGPVPFKDAAKSNTPDFGE